MGQNDTYFGYPEPEGCRNAIIRACISLLLMLVILFAVAALSGCDSVKCLPVTEYVYRTDTVTHVRTDSVTQYQRDSVIVREKGDTVFIDHWRDRWLEKYVYIADSASHSGKHEQTQVQVMEVVPGYYKNCSWALWIIVAAVLVYIVIRIIIKYYTRK